jgi:cellulose synthase/poly-beta-1,6-N-acetylglucosamine synthase-like glycosyltransferase
MMTFINQFVSLILFVFSGLVIALATSQRVVEIFQLVTAGVVSQFRSPVRVTSQLWRRLSEGAPPITLMAPAYNEEMTIVESVRSLMNLQYPEFEVVVVNDGSTDGTLAKLIKAFDLKPVERTINPATPCAEIRGFYAAVHQPRLLVLDKVNGGKADALNAAINVARSPLVCAIDADSILEHDALLRAVQPFIEDPERTIAVGGAIRIANGCRIDHGRIMRVGLPANPWALVQTIEYLRVFLLARMAWSEVGVLTLISGAFGLFDRQALIRVKGFSHGTVGEDMELVIKLHRWFRERKRDYRIVFIPEPVCWTECPETLGDLGRQRQRWQRGALETFFKHADMIADLRYGRIGWLGMGQVLLTDVLDPIAQILGYVLLPILAMTGLLSWAYFNSFLAVSIGFGIAVSLGGLVLEEGQLRRVEHTRDLLLLVAVSVLENFGYRQLCTIWRIQGVYQYLSGATGWGSMTRRGFAVPRAGTA